MAPRFAIWEERFTGFLSESGAVDSAHDLAHVRRVVANAGRISLAESADWEVVMPAAWLHDCVVVPKSSPQRTQASRMASARAVRWLADSLWPFGKLDRIAHAIEAHSFSAGIEPRSVEAKVVQDADRLDALGAVGLARTLMLGAEMKREFYQPDDPFCEHRVPDDSVYTLDHVYRKLLGLESTMQTVGGREEARERTRFLRSFLHQLAAEISVKPDPPASFHRPG